MKPSDFSKKNAGTRAAPWKEVHIAIVILASALAIGFLIQMLLQLRSVSRQERTAESIVGAVLSDLHGLNAEETERREKAALRMEALPAEKKQRLEDLHLELLTIVNPWNPLEYGYEPELATVIEDYKMDARCASIVWDMMQDCREGGYGFPMICSAYRTQEFQEELFENKIVRITLERYCTREEAIPLAAEEVAFPGTSEHQLGLAADIIDELYPYLDEKQEETGTQIWLKDHAADDGFILRYPPGTSDITGIVYEPWHYRYVGVKFAKEISKMGITLEEYAAWRRGR